MSDSLRPHGLEPASLLCPWDFPGKNTGVGCHALLQGIFPTQGLNLRLLRLLHWQAGSLPPAPPRKPAQGTVVPQVTGEASAPWMDSLEHRALWTRVNNSTASLHSPEKLAVPFLLPVAMGGRCADL